MITTLALLSIYKSPLIRLDEISQQYLNLQPEEASRRACRGELPFPVFRMSKSQRSPWVVTADELGGYIDKCSAEARKEWERVQP